MNLEQGVSGGLAPTRLVWIDLEMTGLDTDIHRIIEAAVIVTDFDFNEIDTYHAVINQPEEVLARSNEFVLETFGNNGLFAAVRASDKTERTVEAEVCELISRSVPDGGAYLAGNSIRADRTFIDLQWPKLAGLLHYRMLDVSSFKLWWLGKGKEPYKKSDTHRALDDIRESIAELKYYTSSI